MSESNRVESNSPRFESNRTFFGPIRFDRIEQPLSSTRFDSIGALAALEPVRSGLLEPPSYWRGPAEQGELLHYQACPRIRKRRSHIKTSLRRSFAGEVELYGANLWKSSPQTRSYPTIKAFGSYLDGAGPWQMAHVRLKCLLSAGLTVNPSSGRTKKRRSCSGRIYFQCPHRRTSATSRPPM